MTRASIVDLAPADCWEDAFPHARRHAIAAPAHTDGRSGLCTHFGTGYPDIAAARHALTAAAADSCGAALRWRELAARLPPYRVNPDGALAEWAWPPAGSGLPTLPDNCEHRHVSHPDLAGRLVAALTGQGFFSQSLMSSHYPKRSVYNADAACALPGVLIEMLVDSVPRTPGTRTRIELLPAVPSFLPAGRLRGARTLAGVLVADLRWDTARGDAEAVLMSHTAQHADVGFWQDPAQRVALPAGQPVRITRTCHG